MYLPDHLLVRDMTAQGIHRLWQGAIVFGLLLGWGSTVRGEAIPLTATYSKSLGLPSTKTTVTHAFYIDPTDTVMIEVMSEDSELRVTILTPAGTTITPENVEQHDAGYAQFAGTGRPSGGLPLIADLPGTHYVFDLRQPAPGLYTLRIERGGTTLLNTFALFTVTSTSPVQTAIRTPEKEYTIDGRRVVLSAFVFEDNRPVPGAQVDVAVFKDPTTLSPPTPTTPTFVVLQDDGQQADRVAGDGIYSGG